MVEEQVVEEQVVEEQVVEEQVVEEQVVEEQAEEQVVDKEVVAVASEVVVVASEVQQVQQEEVTSEENNEDSADGGTGGSNVDEDGDIVMGATEPAPKKRTATESARPGVVISPVRRSRRKKETTIPYKRRFNNEKDGKKNWSFQKNNATSAMYFQCGNSNNEDEKYVIVSKVLVHNKSPNADYLKLKKLTADVVVDTWVYMPSTACGNVAKPKLC